MMFSLILCCAAHILRHIKIAFATRVPEEKQTCAISVDEIRFNLEKRREEASCNTIYLQRVRAQIGGI
jgi:hypothetical protein